MQKVCIGYLNEYMVLVIHPNYLIKVPCGKCLECQKRKFRDYRFRLLYELNQFPNSIFITLTFDNLSLSRFKDNPNQSIRLFLDRVRKKYGKQVRHWIVAEYGSKRGRLHYHGILFDIDINNDELFSLWKYGNTFVGYANELTAKYIVKYLTKQDTKGILPPRIISSKGIGSSYLNTPECQLLKKSMRINYEYKGFEVPLPRYYIDKMYSKDERDIISYYYYMEEKEKDMYFFHGRSVTYKEYMRLIKNQNIYNNQLSYNNDDYISIYKQRISSDTRFRLMCNFYGEYIIDELCQKH